MSKNNFPSREQVESVREAYPPGTAVECVRLEDQYAPVPFGTVGEVVAVDSCGTVFVKWSNGSSLGAVLGEDIIKKWRSGDGKSDS
ncbi:hypothetical protein FACS189425_07020 [Clostridia bacterium]|nr:hypothetical protein FACS189425_07020 [Clostridia bacterium]